LTFFGNRRSSSRDYRRSITKKKLLNREAFFIVIV
jgi:hypothetical protein